MLSNSPEDVMFDPGALYTEGSGKALEYLRRLRPQDPPFGWIDREATSKESMVPAE
jgi:hypothetical protein